MYNAPAGPAVSAAVRIIRTQIMYFEGVNWQIKHIQHFKHPKYLICFYLISLISLPVRSEPAHNAPAEPAVSAAVRIIRT